MDAWNSAAVTGVRATTGCLAVLTCVGDLSKHPALNQIWSTTLSRKVHECRSLAVWFTPLGQMGGSLLKKQLWILHTSTARCMFLISPSAENKHMKWKQLKEFFSRVMALVRIVNGRFQCENGVVTSYELKTLPTLMKESGHDCNGTRSSHVHVQQCVTHMVRHSRHCNQGHCLNRDTPSDYQLTDQSQASLRYTTIA